MTRRLSLAPLVALAALLLALPAGAGAAAENCEAEPRPACFAIESVGASISTTQAGAHPDLTLEVAVRQNPATPTNVFGLHNSYAPTRDIRIETPPGLIGDPNVLGTPQQCTVEELFTYTVPGGGCPNGSQVGLSTITAYQLKQQFVEPLYMMQPPGGDIVARFGTIAGVYPTFIDFRVRSESDYGLVAEVAGAPATASLVELDSTLWGVPASPVHDTERCTPVEAFGGCTESGSRPPGSRELAFLTNPTRCGVPLELRVSASSWMEPERFDTASTPFPEIGGCNALPFGPGLALEPTSHRTSSPTGAAITLRLPAAKGVEVLEPSQMRDLRVDLPPGLAINTDASDGLETCSPSQVGFHTREPSHCPDAAKMASTEFDIPVLERNLRGAVYLREPEPGHPFRVWVTADDLGLHVKLPGELEVDKQTGEVASITTDIPQAPLREAKIVLKSGFRAPLVTPGRCGTFQTHYEFTPWSGGPSKVGFASMTISEGCDTGGFSPKLQAGSTDAQGGAFSPFSFTLTREDSEENLAGLALTLPRGLAASFVGTARCEGADADSGHCPRASRIGKVVAAVGAGPTPLWVPQAGKRPTAVYLGGPYKDAPFSIVAVVPKQAGPFDFGDEVVRSAVYVDPETAQATAKADPLPQLIEGIPILYRTINVQLDRPGFSLNPTSCARKETRAELTSSGGKVASSTDPFAAADCAKLPFKPKLGFRLRGGTHRGSHPALTTTFAPRTGDANVGAFSVALPHSEFLDQAHIGTVCTRVQFRADQCPPASVYGTAKVKSPLFDFPLEGPLYLRSSDHPLPDMVAALHGPASFPIEVSAVGRIDSVNGGIRATFDSVPDAPITEVLASFPGGAKGLIVNSTNLCAKANRATAKFIAQNGKRATLHPVLKNSCKKAKKAKRHR